MKSFLKSLALGAGLLLAAHGYTQTYTATPNTKPAASVTPPLATTGAMAATPDTATVAPGGGDGKVWVNSASKKYYCPGTRYYGKTKAGEYMTEADAKSKGIRPNRKKACS